MIVSFDPMKFRETFPDAFPVAVYSDAYLQSCFNRACVQISNAEGSVIPFDQREPILYLATAHVAILGKRDATLTGQITSAGQGSENVSVAVAQAPFNKAWWFLTAYGQECWMACKPYTSFVWVSP
ncbi:MAG TPA: DUF4054 domain-containing protein [Pseudomonas sp.]|uniref:DUF4054 domain-containing protein n=1 Tax=Pseudomonas sp. TaxID=306 RepID=UPI002CD3FEE6|nr:DUF4054 domain-containing protein [Pseudomonas sp.]HWH86166.1 DUF4054 domain-containing protein [Pseudomonas sp.]